MTAFQSDDFVSLYRVNLKISSNKHLPLNELYSRFSTNLHVKTSLQNIFTRKNYNFIEELFFYVRFI